MSKAYFVSDFISIDPDTKADIDMCLYKHEGGGMFAVDFSYLDQVADIDEEDNYIIPDPFVIGEFEALTLIHDSKYM